MPHNDIHQNYHNPIWFYVPICFCFYPACAFIFSPNNLEMIQNKQTIFSRLYLYAKEYFPKQKQIANLQNQYALSNHYPTHFQPPA